VLGKLQSLVRPYRGFRSELLALFGEADDSAREIQNYIELGEVLVARSTQGIILGHIQLIQSGTDWEIKSVAVDRRERRKGIGTALITSALDRAFLAGAGSVLVATAAADIYNLRLYQRVGFRNRCGNLCDLFLGVRTGVLLVRNQTDRPGTSVPVARS
jgi:ribosomal protein S18 acetylase RimI-like enzyme